MRPGQIIDTSNMPTYIKQDMSQISEILAIHKEILSQTGKVVSSLCTPTFMIGIDKAKEEK